MRQQLEYNRAPRAMRLVGLTTAAALLFAGCSAQPEAPGADPSEEVVPVTLRAVTAWDSANTSHYQPFQAFLDAMDEEAESGVTIEVIGGPETMAPTEVAENLANGTVDIALNTASYYSNTLPESLVISLTNLSPAQWRQDGLFDEVNEWHIDTLNQRVLGRLAWGQRYALYTKEPVTSIADFQGMRVRGVAVYQGLLGQLGAEMVDMPASDIYNAIERGTVDGTAWPEPGVSDLSLQEVIGGMTLPNFYSNGLALYINEDAWNRLSADQQSAVDRAVQKAEEAGPDFAEQLREQERDLLDSEGVVITELTGAEAEELLEKATLGAVDVLVNMGVDRTRAEELIAKFNE